MGGDNELMAPKLELLSACAPPAPAPAAQPLVEEGGTVIHKSYNKGQARAPPALCRSKSGDRETLIGVSKVSAAGPGLVFVRLL